MLRERGSHRRRQPRVQAPATPSMGGGNGRRLTSRRRPPSPLPPPPPGRPAPDTSIIITRHGSGGDPVWVTCLPQLPSQKSIIICHHQDQHYYQLQQPPLNQAGCPSPTPPIWRSPSPVTWGRRDMIWQCIWWRKGEWMEVACMTYPRSVSDDFWVSYDIFGLMGEQQSSRTQNYLCLTFCHFLPRWLNSIQNHLYSPNLPKLAACHGFPSYQTFPWHSRIFQTLLSGLSALQSLLKAHQTFRISQTSLTSETLWTCGKLRIECSCYVTWLSLSFLSHFKCPLT